MAKRESTFKNMVVTLFVVTFTAAAALGFVYDLTKDAIEQSKIKAQSEAIEKVLPEFDELGISFKVAAPSSTDSLSFSLHSGTENQLGWLSKPIPITGSAGIFQLWQVLTIPEIFQDLKCLNMPKHPDWGRK